VEISSVTITLTGDTSANLKALVLHGGSSQITSVGFYYDTISLPNLSSSVAVNSATVGSFSARIGPLFFNKKYFIRSFLTNAEGTHYGPESSFITTSGWYKINSAVLSGVALNYIEAKGNSICLGTENGVMFSSDTGNTWKNIGLQGKSITSISLVGTTIFAACSPYVYKTEDNGVTWTESSSFPVANYQYRINKLVFSGDKIFAVATFYAYVSSDGGVSWTRLQNGLNSVQGYLIGIAAIDSVLIVVSSQAQVYLSTNQGQSWSPTPVSGMTGKQPFALNVVSNKFHVSLTNSQGYFSSDGSNWQEATIFPANPEVLFSSGTGIFTYGYSNGSIKAFLSENSGQSWTSYSFIGFQGMMPSRLLFTENYLFAISPETGLFRRKR
jgi:hypothetical protein